jgi:hypothetical protein
LRGQIERSVTEFNDNFVQELPALNRLESRRIVAEVSGLPMLLQIAETTFVTALARSN